MYIITPNQLRICVLYPVCKKKLRVIKKANAHCLLVVSAPRLFGFTKRYMCRPQLIIHYCLHHFRGNVSQRQIAVRIPNHSLRPLCCGFRLVAPMASSLSLLSSLNQSIPRNIDPLSKCMSVNRISQIRKHSTSIRLSKLLRFRI